MESVHYPPGQGPFEMVKRRAEAARRGKAAAAPTAPPNFNAHLEALAEALAKRASEEIRAMRAAVEEMQADLDQRQLQNERAVNKRLASMETELRAVIGRRIERAVLDARDDIERAARRKKAAKKAAKDA